MSAIVTGSGRGIGRAIAVRLAMEGFPVVLNVKRHVEEGEEALREVNKHGKGLLVQADVATKEGAAELVGEAMDAFGSIEVLVNNAGLGIARPLVEVDEVLWDKLIGVNLKSAYLMSREVLPHMMERRRGHIINITSVAGIMGLANLVPYSAAKAGVIGLTKALAAEVGSMGIRVNAIAAGLVKTKMGDSLMEYVGEAEDEWARNHTLTGSAADPGEVAELVATLVTKVRNMTGQVIVLDSGSSLVESSRFASRGK